MKHGAVVVGVDGSPEGGAALDWPAAPRGRPHVRLHRARLAQLFNAFNSRRRPRRCSTKCSVNRCAGHRSGSGPALPGPREVLFLQLAFGTAPLDLTHLVVCAAMASTVLRFDELRKVFLWHSPAD